MAYQLQDSNGREGIQPGFVYRRWQEYFGNDTSHLLQSNSEKDYFSQIETEKDPEARNEEKEVQDCWDVENILVSWEISQIELLSFYNYSFFSYCDSVR